MSLPTPDSLHIYLRPDHATESLPMGPSYSFAGFADDMIFRAYWRYGDWEELSGYEVADGLYADNPNVVIQTDSGPNMTHINEIGNNLVAVSTQARPRRHHCLQPAGLSDSASLCLRCANRL